MACKWNRLQTLELVINSPAASFRVEYTDCFGRSRRIPKEDLAKIKAQDSELSDVVEARSDQVDPSRNAPRTPESAGEVSESESESEMIGPPIGLQFQKQREEWEKQEHLNTERSEVHYQDVLFDGECLRKNQRHFGFYKTSNFIVEFGSMLVATLTVLVMT